MTSNTQNLDVGDISPQFWMLGVRFFVVAVKAVLAAALLAETNLLESFIDRAPGGVIPFRAATIPFGVILPARSGGDSAATSGAISGGPAISLSALKALAAIKADIINHRGWLARLYESGASLRAASGLPSHMSIMAAELLAADLTYQYTGACRRYAAELGLVSHLR